MHVPSAGCSHVQNHSSTLQHLVYAIYIQHLLKVQTQALGVFHALVVQGRSALLDHHARPVSECVCGTHHQDHPVARSVDLANLCSQCCMYDENHGSAEVIVRPPVPGKIAALPSQIYAGDTPGEPRNRGGSQYVRRRTIFDSPAPFGHLGLVRLRRRTDVFQHSNILMR